jgi:phosphohistidine swiveling domain-containing protein
MDANRERGATPLRTGESMSGADGGRLVGRGTAVWDGDPYVGTVREVTSSRDALDLLDNPVDDLVVLCHSGGATSLAPLFGDIRGVICTTGSEGAHLAILSRDFGIPCIVGAELSEADLDGKRVRLEADGTVVVLDD